MLLLSHENSQQQQQPLSLSFVHLSSLKVTAACALKFAAQPETVSQCVTRLTHPSLIILK